MDHALLIINPGSTSTKIAVYEDEREVLSENISHSAEELAPFARIVDQKGFRKDIVLETLRKKGVEPADLAAVVGRGGLLAPIPSGVYRVNDRMLEDLFKGVQGEHASNLGGLIADEIARPLGLPAFIVDPVVVDELDDWARLSGVPDIRRRSIFHALNHKYSARLAARELGRSYESLDLIVCHLGGGITVGAHKHGRVVDVNNGLERRGAHRPGAGRHGARGRSRRPGLLRQLRGEGPQEDADRPGRDGRPPQDERHAGDAQARRRGRRAGRARLRRPWSSPWPSRSGPAPPSSRAGWTAIVLTGGLAFATEFIDRIKEHVQFLGPVFVFPGENEMVALAEAGLRVIRGEDEARIYPSSSEPDRRESS